VLTMLAPGEEVISNRYGQADRHRPLLRKINAGGMADGGTVDGSGGISVGIKNPTPFGDAIAAATLRLHQLEASLKDSTQELDQERAHRNALAQQRQQLVSTVQSSFMTDIFGTSYPDNGIWSTGPVGLEDPNKILRQDIKDAREYRDDIKKLKRRGLSGGALASVTSLEAAQQALGETPQQLRETSRLFRIRQRAAHAAGADLGDDIYGRRLDTSNRHLDKIKDHTAGIRDDIHQLNEHLRHLRHEQQVAEAKRAKAAAKQAKDTGTAVGNAINGAASTAAKRRNPK
jgi:hypothetical protein